MSDTRTVTNGTVGVRELGQSLPPVRRDVLLVRLQPFHCVNQGVFLRLVSFEDQLCFKEEANWPDPLRSLVVVEAVRFIRVVVVSVVVHIIGVKGFNSHASLFHENLANVLKTNFCMLWVKKFWCVAHGNWNITSQLVVSILIGRAQHILVNPSSIDELCIDLIVFILILILGNPEMHLEVIHHLFSPVSELDDLLFSWSFCNLDTILFNGAFLVHSRKPTQY